MRISRKTLAVVAMATTLLAMTTTANAAKLNKKKASVTAGKTVTLTLKGAKGAVTWSVKGKAAKIESKSKDGATVTVKGVKKGTATVAAKNGKKTFKCKVTVKNPDPKLSKSSVTVEEGKSEVVGIEWPAGKAKAKMSAKQKKLATVKVSKKAVKITGKKAGKTSFYVYSGKKKLKLTVNVVKKGQAPQTEAKQPQTKAPQTETANPIVKPQPQTSAPQPQTQPQTRPQTQTKAPETQPQTQAPQTQPQTQAPQPQTQTKVPETQTQPQTQAPQTSASPEYDYTSDFAIAGGRSKYVGAYTDTSIGMPQMNTSITIEAENDRVSIESRITSDTAVNALVYGRKAGACKIYIKDGTGKTLHVTNVTVTSDDADYAKYQSWKAGVKAQIWTSGMNSIEKLEAIAGYVTKNYDYYANCSSRYGFSAGTGGNCWASTDLLIDVARDLGLKAEAYHPKSAGYSALHYLAKIWIGGDVYFIDAGTGGKAGARGYYVKKNVADF